MLLIKNISNWAFVAFLSLFLTACVPSPMPNQSNSEKLENFENSASKRKLLTQDENSLEVVEKGFEIIHDGQDENQIKAELISLHKELNTDYKIGAGDKFNVFVYGEPELNIKGGIIKPDGTLTLQLIGDVKVAGLSINKAMEKISKKLKRFIINPIVTLIPYEFRSKSFTILGKVSQPGTYQISSNTKVLDTIAIAQGLSIGIFENNTIELADLEHAFIRRENKVLPVNFIELVRKGNPLHNIPLTDKDYIYIPSALNTEVYILGEVNIPGHYGFKERMTMTQLLSHAKGYNKEANINQVAVIRGNLTNPVVYLVDLEDILEGKSKDFLLKPFDIVFFPTSILGTWNNILAMLMPSLETVQSAYILNQLTKGD